MAAALQHAATFLPPYMTQASSQQQQQQIFQLQQYYLLQQQQFSRAQSLLSPASAAAFSQILPNMPSPFPPIQGQPVYPSPDPALFQQQMASLAASMGGPTGTVPPRLPNPMEPLRGPSPQTPLIATSTPVPIIPAQILPFGTAVQGAAVVNSRRPSALDHIPAEAKDSAGSRERSFIDNNPEQHKMANGILLDTPASSESTGQRSFPRGLTNETGQNNCFLNVVVQSLWHLDAFREPFWAAHTASKISSLPEPPSPSKTSLHEIEAETNEVEDKERIRRALIAVFEGLSGVTGTGVGAREGITGDGHGKVSDSGAVSVDALRAALQRSSRAAARLFGEGQMDDAVEALEVVLGSLPSDLQDIVKDTFCMNIEEVLECEKCGASTPDSPHSYGTNTFYVPIKLLQV